MIYKIDKHNSEASDRVINCEMCGALVLLREAHKHIAFHENQHEQSRSRIITMDEPNTGELFGGVR